MSDIAPREDEVLQRTRQFVPEMTVAAALAQHAAARWVFAAYRIGGCSHCAMSDEETLEQVAVAYDLDIEKLLRDLNSLLIS